SAIVGSQTRTASMIRRLMPCSSVGWASSHSLTRPRRLSEACFPRLPPTGMVISSATPLDASLKRPSLLASVRLKPMLMVDKPSRGWQRPWVVGVYSAALADSLYSLWRYAVRGVGGGAFLGLPRMSPAFADLRQLTHSAGCSASAQALLANAANCDPFGRPFNYTPFSLAILRALHLTAASTPALGAILGASSLLLVSVFFLTATESKDRALVAAAICFMGFPFQLALERGNYDLVAFE